jgi:hypothetical protein
LFHITTCVHGPCIWQRAFIWSHRVPVQPSLWCYQLQ